MENIEKCLNIAMQELGKISFSGKTVIPAGRAMDALYLAAQEVAKLKAERAKTSEGETTDNKKEGTNA